MESMKKQATHDSYAGEQRRRLLGFSLSRDHVPLASASLELSLYVVWTRNRVNNGIRVRVTTKK